MHLATVAVLVFAGPSSWYGGPCDGQDNNIPAFGPANSQPGIALYRTSSARRPFLLRGPNGRRVVVRHSDFGPAPWTGKVVDVNYTAAAALGYGSPCPAYPTGAWANVRQLRRGTVCPNVRRTRTRYDNRANPWCKRRAHDRGRAKRRPPG